MQIQRWLCDRTQPGGKSSWYQNGAAPFIANEIKKQIPDEEADANLKRTIAHGIANAALALAKGENVAAQATGAMTGEAIGILAEYIYNKQPNELTEQEKENVSAWATLASGLAGGLAGGDTQSVANAAQAGKTTVENNAFNLAGRTQKEIESSIQKQVDGVDLDEIYGDDQSKKDAYKKGREQGVKDGLKDGTIEVLEGTANSILHPIDTVTDLSSAIWNYDQTIDAIKISVTQWNELYEYAKVNDPELAGQMVGSLQGKVLGNLGTSVVVSGAAAKTIQKVAQLKNGAVKTNPNEIKRPTSQQSEKDCSGLINLAT
ncbi:TPA: VENN motif pre-toxin domain-containing protein [Escherichia coli]|nr:VENN motif pre-toxin domain-containing protein [Escherichia coli]